jgi:predicted metal-dependent peptidase
MTPTELSSHLLRIRAKAPFLGSLALQAQYKASTELPTAATDGKDVFYNPAFFASLKPFEREAVLMHEVLHAALLHVPRRGKRDPKLYNIAADYVVNEILAQSGFVLPESALRRPEWQGLSVEEAFELLRQQQERQEALPELLILDLLEPSDSQDGQDSNKKGQISGELRQALGRALEKHWKKAIEQALLSERAFGKGNVPAGVLRASGRERSSQLDWRSLLWRYLISTPNDFQGFDRRFFGRGLYLEELRGERVQVFICIDTSGSVEDELIGQFMSEVRSILGTYPTLEGQLYYADAALYGPYSIEQPPSAIGGGGTDFRPFFEAIEQHYDPNHSGVCVYLTDGYGDFPSQAPKINTLWVVAPGGLESEQFPFGEVVRLVS